MNTALYACPVCQLPLLIDSRRWTCSNNHSFDQHKKGYVNLLLTQNKRSKMPGDDPEMVISRRRFLQAGHYAPLAQSIAQQLNQRLDNNGTVWDAGCGEGYYTALCAEQNPLVQFYGLDISKPAVTAASQYKQIHWCVASSTRPPYLAESFDAIMSIFSRVDSSAFHSVLKPGGLVCMVTPDHDHLMALREQIYETVRPYDIDKHRHYFDDRFVLESESRLEFELQLTDNQSILDLLGMTPHAHRLPTVTREKLSELDELADKACFKIYWFRKTP